MKISSAIGMGLGLAMLGAVGVGAYVLLSNKSQAYRQSSVPTQFSPPVAEHGASAVPQQTEPRKSDAQQAKEWLGVAEDSWDVAKGIVDDISSWAS